MYIYAYLCLERKNPLEKIHIFNLALFLTAIDPRDYSIYDSIKN